MRSRIHITGAAGSGTTTLGRVLAGALGSAQFDSDDYLWEPSDPPYRHLRPREERVRLLAADLNARDSWVLSGSLTGWGNPLVSLFDLVVLVSTPTAVRINRLQKREVERFGSDALAPGGVMHEQYLAFMEWASRYDDGDESIRSRRLHEKWLATVVTAPVLGVDGQEPTEALVACVLETLGEKAATGSK